jgi:hypothetical protein
MVAPAVQGIDLFKIAGRSISGWIPSLKTGTASHVRQPFCSQLEGLCCKNSRGDTMGGEASLLLSLGDHSKQASDERHLPQDVPFFHTIHLPLPNDVHTLISL